MFVAGSALDQSKFVRRCRHCGVGFIVLLASRLEKFRHSHIPTFRQATPVTFDSFDFVKGRCREVTGPAVWATNNRHLFDNEQVCAFAVAVRH